MAQAESKLTTPRKILVKSNTKNDLLELEGDLCSAVNMAGIAAELVENKLSESGVVTLQPGEAELILFAVYEAYLRMKAVRARYLDALEKPARKAVR